MPESLEQLRADCAVKLLNMYRRANAGHIGASLSCLEILLYVFARKMGVDDKFLLSKGHAAGALYVVLDAMDRLDGQSLESFYKEDTLLAAHPPCGGSLKTVPFGTGSLGHGLSLATGLAFARRYTQKDFNVYTVLSEGDCNEGSTWEAALFAGHHALENLVVIVDANGLQGLGRSDDIMKLNPLEAKWREFGFETVVCDHGNNLEALAASFARLGAEAKPKCIVAKTIKGHGVSFMQNEMSWHYLPMSATQFDQAINETTGETKKHA